ISALAIGAPSPASCSASSPAFCRYRRSGKIPTLRSRGGRRSSGPPVPRPLLPITRSRPRRSPWPHGRFPTTGPPPLVSRAARALTDGGRRALGLGGTALRRNTPSLLNLAWGKQFFWDGRAPSLETQVGMPIAEPQEMGGDWPTILRRLEADDDLVRQFHAA